MSKNVYYEVRDRKDIEEEEPITLSIGIPGKQPETYKVGRAIVLLTEVEGQEKEYALVQVAGSRTAYDLFDEVELLVNSIFDGLVHLLEQDEKQAYNLADHLEEAVDRDDSVTVNFLSLILLNKLFGSLFNKDSEEAQG